jgi:peptidoglycan hydrolase CwlO-like protein
MDYVVLVERKSRKEKDESVLYLIIQQDGKNAVAGFTADDVDRAKRFLNNLYPMVEEAYLEMQIKEQEDVVVKAEKKYKKLQDDKADMESKIRKLEDDIETNIRNQEDTRKDIENQKRLLDDLRLKRKSL